MRLTLCNRSHYYSYTALFTQCQSAVSQFIAQSYSVTKESVRCTADGLDVLVPAVGEGEALEKIVTTVDSSHVDLLIVMTLGGDRLDLVSLFMFLLIQFYLEELDGLLDLLKLDESCRLL